MADGPWGDTPQSDIIITTTQGIDGRPVRRYCGIVTGEVIVGANLFRDLFAGVRDIVGGRSGAYEQVLGRAREEALVELRAQAIKLGANGSMLMVSATGTAVEA